MPPRIPPRAIDVARKKKFNTDDFMSALSENLPVERETEQTDTEPDSADWDEISRLVEETRRSRQKPSGPDMSQYEGMSLGIKPEEPSVYRKVLNALNEPLSGGYFGRKAKDIADTLISNKEHIKATGKGDVQDWNAWLDASIRGAARGGIEGVGNLIDEFTAPADLAGLALTGGAMTAARRGWKGVNALRRAAQATGTPVVAHGIERMNDVRRQLSEGGEFDMDTAKELGMGAFQTAMGGLQFSFPEAALPKPRVRPKVKVAAGATPHVPEPMADQSFRMIGPEQDFAGGATIQRPNTPPPPAGGLNRQDIRPIQSYKDRGIADEFRGPDIYRNPPRPDEAVAKINQQVEAAQAPPPEPLGSLESPQDVRDPNRIIRPGDINDQLFPDLAGRTPKRNLDLGIQEAPLATPEAAPATPDRPAAVARLNELGLKSTLTTAEEAEYNSLVDFLMPAVPNRSVGQIASNFMGSEEGSIDIGKILGDRSAREEALKRRPPVQSTGRFPGEEATDIGAMPEREIDLEQAGYEAASDTAKPVQDVRQRQKQDREIADIKREIAFDRNELDLYRNSDDPNSATSQEGIAFRESRLAKNTARLRQFLGDEEGSINFGDPDFIHNIKRRKKGTGFVDDEAGVYPGYARGVGTPEAPGQMVEDFDTQWSSGSVASDINGIDITKHDTPDSLIAANQRHTSKQPTEFWKEQDVEFDPMSMVRGFLKDEEGSINLGPKEPKKPKKAPRETAIPDPQVVWDQLPGNVKKAFTEAGVTLDDIRGSSMRELEDYFNQLVRERAGIDSAAGEAPAPKSRLVGNIPKDKGVVDVSGLKTEGGKVGLVKKTGERVPLDEEAQIKRLTQEAMEAVEREKSILLDMGEAEMTPEALAEIRAKMAAGDTVMPPVGNPPPVSRETMKGLRSRDYLKSEPVPQKKQVPTQKMGARTPDWLKNFMKDESGEIRMGPDENPMSRAGTNEFAMDLEQKNEPVLGGESPAWTPRTPPPGVQPPDPSVLQRIMQFMNDESGELKFGEGEAQAPIDEAMSQLNRPGMAPLGRYYIENQLESAGRGEPGIAAQADPRYPSKNMMQVVYRGPDGNPVAVARVNHYPGEGWSVSDLAADPSRGMLKGRAVKAIVDELIEIGALKASGEYSDATANLAHKVRQRMNRKNIKGGEAPPQDIDFRAQREAAHRQRMEESQSQYEAFDEPAVPPEATPQLSNNRYGELEYDGRLISRGRSDPEVLEALWYDYGDDFRRMGQEDWNNGYDQHAEDLAGRPDPYEIDDVAGEIAGRRVAEAEMQQYRRSNPDLPTSANSVSYETDNTPILDDFMGDANEMYALGLEIPAPNSGRASLGPGVTPGAQMRAPGGIDDGIVPLSFRDRLRNFMGSESGEVNFGESMPAPPKRIGPKGQMPAESGPDIRLLGEDQLDPSVPIRGRNVPPEQVPSNAREAWNLGQSMMSIDLPYITSAAFRQASPLAWTENWFKAWHTAAEAFGSKEAADAIDAAIRESKYFKPRYKPIVDQDGNIKAYKELPSIAEELGVRMSDYKHLTNREETLRGTWAEKLPLYGDYVKSSNRAYSTFLNSLRKAKFEELMDARKWSGKPADEMVAKQIAEFVNDATGRSSLRMKTPLGEINAEKNAENLALALWSPRLLARNMRMLNPLTYVGLDPMVRKEYLNGLMRTLGTWGGFAGLAKMMGAEVNSDPTNADFGKIKMGNTRIDPGAGMQQLLVFYSRLATGQFTSSSTGETTVMGQGFKPRTRKSTIEEFAASKLHPSAKLAYDLLSASQSSPVHVTDRAVQMALPMMAQDLIEVLKSDPELAALIGPLSSVGMGTSNYGRGDEYGAPVFTDTIEQSFDLPHRSISGTVGGKTPKRF